MILSRSRPGSTSRRRLGLAALAALPLLTGLSACSGGDAPDVTPAAVTIAPGGGTVVAGTTLTLTATVTNKAAQPLTAAAVTWQSSDPSVANVNGGVVTGGRVGTAQVTATAGTASASVSITVVPGVPASVTVRTQPGGAAAGALLSPQPVVEVRDGSGNLVTTGDVNVTVTLTTGGGTLGGTTRVAAVQGVATFTNLAVSGAVGARTLAFAVTPSVGATSAPFTITAGPAVALALRTQPGDGTLGAALTRQPVVEVQDAFGNLAASTARITATLASGSGTLNGTTALDAVGGVAAFTTLRIDGATEGPRTLTFTAPGLTPVTSSPFTVSFGVTVTLLAGGQRAVVLDPARTIATTMTVRAADGTDLPATRTYLSRGPGVATVSATGVITAVAEGGTWILGSITDRGNPTDSVWVNVTRSATGPVLRLALTDFGVAAGVTTEWSLLLDTRDATVGGLSLTVGLPTGITTTLGFANLAAGTLAAINAETAQLRFTLVSATGVTGTIELARVRMGATATRGRTGPLALQVTDIVTPTGLSLLPATSVLSYFLVTR